MKFIILLKFGSQPVVNILILLIKALITTSKRIRKPSTIKAKEAKYFKNFINLLFMLLIVSKII